jgi:4-hydroxy-tetrahydrodipicolinate synthase
MRWERETCRRKCCPTSMLPGCMANNHSTAINNMFDGALSVLKREQLDNKNLSNTELLVLYASGFLLSGLLIPLMINKADFMRCACFSGIFASRMAQKVLNPPLFYLFNAEKTKNTMKGRVYMRKPLFTGSGVAIVTPFTDDGVDYNKLEELIEFQIKEGIDSIIICGTTGEASTMPDDEHKATMKFTVEKVNGRVPVIAGAGSNDTRHAIELSKYAEEVGADAILTVTPYYNKTTQKGLYEHFKAIANSIKIPVVLYNVPSRTNLNINPYTMKALSEIDNIVAVKECNLAQAGEVANLCGENFTLYTGNDDQVLPILALGGKGVISVMANIIPKDTHDMVMKFLEGDIAGSRKLQFDLFNLIKGLFIEVNPIPVKAAMNLMGMNVGKCRLPLVDMSDKNLEILKKAMKEYGLI